MFALTILSPCILESCMKMKINVNFFPHFFAVPQKVLYGFLRPTLDDSTIKKCENENLSFSLRMGSGRE